MYALRVSRYTCHICKDVNVFEPVYIRKCTYPCVYACLHILRARVGACVYNCMYIRMCVPICTWSLSNVSVRVSLLCMYIAMHFTCIHSYRCAQENICSCVCVCVYMHVVPWIRHYEQDVYIYIYIYIYTHTHTHTHTVPKSMPIVAPPAAFRQPSTSVYYRSYTTNTYYPALAEVCKLGSDSCSTPGYAVQWPYMQVGSDPALQVNINNAYICVYVYKCARGCSRTCFST